MWDFYPAGRRLRSSSFISASLYQGTDQGLRAGFERSSVFKIPEMRWNLQLGRL